MGRGPLGARARPLPEVDALKLPLPVLIVLSLLFSCCAFVATVLIAHRVRLATGGHLRHWLRAWLGLGLGVAELSRRVGVPEEALVAFAPQYKEVVIPKRRGGGLRRLLVPDASTKALQRRILRRVLGRLRAHECACGFERGRSIVDNARPHVGRAVVVRLDVVDFFPSTTAARVEAYFRRVGWNAASARLLARFTTHDGGLPQGAPTSPRLSNLVNVLLDAQLQRVAGKRHGFYTRYADDIAFSFPKDYPKKVRGAIQTARKRLRAFGYRLHGRPKLSVRRRHQRQEVTGLVVNDKVQLPRRTRRFLRAVRHRLATGGQATLTPAQVQGWLAFAWMVEGQAGRTDGAA